MCKKKKLTYVDSKSNYDKFFRSNKDINFQFSYGAQMTRLMLAIKYKDTNTVRELINAGADLEVKDAKGYTALIWAVYLQKKEEAELLIDAGANLEAKDSHGLTPLLTAALDCNSLELVTLLLEKGSNINETDNDQRTALILATKNNKIEVLKLLLTKRPNLEAKDNGGETALIIAAKYQNIEVLELLINAGANVEAKDNYGRTALISSAHEGHTEGIKLLLAKGAILEAKDNGGETALIIAARDQNIEALELLINAGANVEAKNNDCRTALMWLGFRDHTEAIKLLLAKGADIVNYDHKNESSIILRDNILIDFCLNCNNNNIILKIKDKLQTYKPNSKALKFILFEEEYDNAENYDTDLIMYFFITRGIDKLNSEGKTFLWHAVYNAIPMENDYQKMATWLLDNGANPNIADRNAGFTPLYISVLHGNFPIFIKLVSKGADIHAPIQNLWGTRNLLHIALELKDKNKKDSVVNYLIKNFVDVNQKDSKGRTPLDLAKDDATKNKLLAHGAKQSTKEVFNEVINTKRPHADEAPKLEKSLRIQSHSAHLAMSDLMVIDKIVLGSLMKINAEEVSYEIKSIANKAASLRLMPEYDHQIDHKLNIKKLIEQIKNKELDETTIILLERLEYGELSFSTVKALAKIIANNPQVLAEIKEINIYYDALLYNIAKAYNIQVVGLGVVHLPDVYDPFYAIQLEAHLKDRVKTIMALGYSVVFPVGSLHIEALGDLGYVDEIHEQKLLNQAAKDYEPLTNDGENQPYLENFFFYDSAFTLMVYGNYDAKQDFDYHHNFTPELSTQAIIALIGVMAICVTNL